MSFNGYYLLFNFKNYLTFIYLILLFIKYFLFIFKNI